jgi:tetratricopeptide (TPR) repeat protein
MTRYIDQFLTWARGRLGPVLFAVGLLLYLATTTRDVVVGPSASFLALHLNLHKFPSLSHFVWGWLVRSVAAIAGSQTVFVLNVLSALFGALSLWLLYVLMIRVPRDRTAEEAEARFPWEPVQCISAIVAVLFLGFCMPFWVVSTRAHPASFDVFLLLFVTWVLVRFSETQRRGLLYTFAFSYGLGVTEFSTFIIFAPAYALVVFLLVWRSGRYRLANTLFAMGALFVAGLTPYILGALEYRISPAYEWREFTSFFQIVWFAWVEQYREIRFSLPYVGGVMVFLMSALPWIVVASPKRAMTRNAVLGSNFFHAVLGALAVAIAYNMRLAPWPMLGSRVLLVVPYLLTAMWVGYVAGYWYLFFFVSSRFEHKGRATMRGLGRVIYVPALLAALIAAGALNYPNARATAGRAINDLAQSMLKQMGPSRSWLITYGILDDAIAVEAFVRKQPLRIINALQMGAKPYRRYVASLFENPRLQGLAYLGFGPLIAEWVQSTPDIGAQIAVLENPDIWYSEGVTPVPHPGWYEGAREVGALNMDALLEEHRAFWRTTGQALSVSARRPSPAQPWLQWCVRSVSKSANNLGVMLEDAARSEDAVACYQAALQLDTNNISALLNWLWLAEREKRPDLDRLQLQAEDFARRLRSRLRVWALAQQYGYVRAPEAFTRRGWAWVLSGKAGVGVQDMRRAADLGAPSERVDLALASAYAAQDLQEESEAAYDRVLADNPDNVAALIGKLHLVVRKGAVEKAMELLGRLRALGVPQDVTAVEEATIELADGNKDVALDVLRKLVKESPKNHRAWGLLALVSDDPKVVDDAVGRLKSLAPNFPQTLWTLALVERKRGDLTAERNYLDRLLKARPGNVPALERLLQLDVLQSQRDEAERRVEQLLKIRPSHTLANYVLGTIQYSRGEIRQAEASYRAALAGGRYAPAMNDLAWILQSRDRLDEARALIEEALAQDSTSPVYHDTAGVIYMKLGDYAKAQQHLQAALARAPEQPDMLLHMAMLYEKQGMSNEAMRIADNLMANPSGISPEGFENLRKLVERLRKQ